MGNNGSERSPDVGSSSTTTSLPPMKANATDSFRFCPPERAEAGVCFFSTSPTSDTCTPRKKVLPRVNTRKTEYYRGLVLYCARSPKRNCQEAVAKCYNAARCFPGGYRALTKSSRGSPVSPTPDVCAPQQPQWPRPNFKSPTTSRRHTPQRDSTIIAGLLDLVEVGKLTCFNR